MFVTDRVLIMMGPGAEIEDIKDTEVIEHLYRFESLSRNHAIALLLRSHPFVGLCNAIVDRLVLRGIVSEAEGILHITDRAEDVIEMEMYARERELMEWDKIS